MNVFLKTARRATIGFSFLSLLAGTLAATGEAQLKSSSFAPTIQNKTPPQLHAPKGMVWIPGGEFSMGSEDPSTATVCSGHEHMPDARPIHRVYVDGFWMDKTEVTNEQFEKFVEATGYRTVAETAPTQDEFPTAPKENLVAGSTVFTPTPHAVALDNMFQWWRYQHGADWRHPEGPKSNIEGRKNYPVVKLRTTMQLRTHIGPANDSRQKPNGNSPLAEAEQGGYMPGAMTSSPRESSWATSMKDRSR